ncbi:MAG: NusG domain II-containing protein [Eubacterium sp.]|nr:NusG domain II-containing protein [Eubacterium sp.]
MRRPGSVVRKADIILLAVLVLFGAALSVPALLWRGSGTDVKVTVDGKLYGTYDLSEDQTVEIARSGHTNVIRIEGGKVFMESASCRNQVCVHTGRISHSGQSIVCLPNRVSVTIEGKEGNEYDAVSGK